MEHRKQTSERSPDSLEVGRGEHPFDLSATAWLVGQAVRYLQTADEEGKLAYGRVIESLGGRTDVVETVIQLIKRARLSDVPLRWSLVYLLGDIEEPTAAEFLTRLAVEPLSTQEEEKGCEGPRDGEILMRTMAVESLQRIATRHTEAAEYLLKVASERPARPILIEAVKAAIHLGLKEKVRELLREEEYWILDIRQVRIEEIIAEPERRDVKERGFTPPKMPSDSTTPRVPYESHQPED